MNTIIQPWHLLLTALAGLMNREQQQIIEYLQAENSILKEYLRGRRIRYTDKQRRRLAVMAKALGRKILGQIDTIRLGDIESIRLPLLHPERPQGVEGQRVPT